MWQEDSEDEGASGEPTVTSQPTSQQAFAMPAPSEATSLKTSDQVTYTPGSRTSSGHYTNI